MSRATHLLDRYLGYIEEKQKELAKKEKQEKTKSRKEGQRRAKDKTDTTELTEVKVQVHVAPQASNNVAKVSRSYS